MGGCVYLLGIACCLRLPVLPVASAMMDGLRIYYNFMRPHMALDGKTPAQKARIADSSTPESWKSLIKKATKAKNR
jgi:hypothetical protein